MRALKFRMTLGCLVSRVLRLGRKTARAQKLLSVMVHGPKAVLMVVLLLWQLAALTSVRLLIWGGSQSTGDHGTVLQKDVVGRGTMGIPAAGRAISANMDVFPGLIGDIVGDRGNIRVL